MKTETVNRALSNISLLHFSETLNKVKCAHKAFILD